MPAPNEDVELYSMNDAAAEPLIANASDVPSDARDHYDDEGEIIEQEVDESALVSPGLFIWCLTICAGVSGLLFGYEYVLVFSASYLLPFRRNKNCANDNT